MITPYAQYFNLKQLARVDRRVLILRMYVLIVLIVCGVVFGWLLWRLKNHRMIKMAEKIPGPPPLPLLGNAHLFMADSEGFLKTIDRMMDLYGDVVKLWLGPDLNVIVKNPDDLKYLLASPKTTAKGPAYKYMADYLGGGILSGSGPTWRKHRKIANPNYGKRAVQSYNSIFNDEVEILIRDLQHTKEEISIYKHTVVTTSIAVCRTLMGLTRDETLALPHFHRIVKDTPRIYATVFDRMRKWFLQIDPIFWATQSHRHAKDFLNAVVEFTTAIINHRKNVLKNQNVEEDLLNATEDSTENTVLSVIDRFILSEELDSKEMIDETFTIFTSSQEATAKISSFFIMMMAFHPLCQEKLYAEIINVLGEEDKPVNGADLKQMPYLEMCFKEVVRLFPIGAMLQRTVLEDIEISSHTIPAGSSLIAPIFQLHRDPRYWSNPNGFDPERFDKKTSNMGKSSAYLPFAIGPMDCLGRHFGINLVKILCVRLLRHFEFYSSQTYQDMRIIISISAKSVTGYPVRLRPRKFFLGNAGNRNPLMK